MNVIVIYKSRTGFTKRYAEWISEALGCEAVAYQSIGGVDLGRYDLVVYGGSVRAGRIDGLARMQKLLGGKACKLVVFATGATPAAASEEIDRMMEQQFGGSGIPHFYMQAGLCYEKMGFVDRAMMKALSKMLSGKENKSDAETGMAAAIRASFDHSDRSQAAPLVDFVRSSYPQ